MEQNKELKGEKLMQAAKDKDWDPSVKAMLEFPDVLSMMNEKLEWTEKLGDAFLSQQKDVMALPSVSDRRRRNRETSRPQRSRRSLSRKRRRRSSSSRQAPRWCMCPRTTRPWYTGPGRTRPIHRTPVYAYPYGAGLAFAAGVAVGAAWSGHGGWGCGWGNNEVDVNVNKQNTFTQNNYNNSQKYQKKEGGGKNQNWQHNPEHRKGAQYKDQRTARSMGSRVPGPGPRQRHQTPGATVKVQATRAVENLRRATSVVAEVIKVVESLKRATPVVAGGKRAV